MINVFVIFHVCQLACLCADGLFLLEEQMMSQRTAGVHRMCPSLNIPFFCKQYVNQFNDIASLEIPHGYN